MSNASITYTDRFSGDTQLCVYGGRLAVEHLEKGVVVLLDADQMVELLVQAGLVEDQDDGDAHCECDLFGDETCTCDLYDEDDEYLPVDYRTGRLLPEVLDALYEEAMAEEAMRLDRLSVALMPLFGLDGEPQEEPTQGYVQSVPDRCDRILWRGSYHSLPVMDASEDIQFRPVTADYDSGI